MVNQEIDRGDAAITAAEQVLSGHGGKRGLTRLLPFLGPVFIASIAYVDPGNFATNIQGGAQFGYLLLWVVVAGNLMAMLIQTLSAKLGIATGHNLAELCRMHYPGWLVWLMWGIMELVAIATDLAEFLGAARGFQPAAGHAPVDSGVGDGRGHLPDSHASEARRSGGCNCRNG